jgi:hypothetical protein
MICKKYLMVMWAIGCHDIAFSQNAGIGTISPIDKLTVQTANNAFGITHTDGAIRLST